MDGAKVLHKHNFRYFFIINVFFLKFRYQRLFNKKSQRYTAFALKVPKEFPHIPELMEKVVRRRVLDRIGMKRKMVLEDDDPRRIARTLAPAPPPTSVIVKEKKSRLSKD